MTALDLLTGDAQAFQDTLWGSRVHLHRTQPDGLVALLPIDAVDHLLTSTAIRTPAVRVVRDGAVLASSSYVRSATIAGQPLTGLVDPRKVLDLFAGGATVVLQGLHRYWSPLSRLVRDLEVELGHPCQANAYLTPPGAQGFAKHQDSHDVFVVQTHGTKHWTVADEELDLAPGLSLYLPTGTMHAARSQDDVSLHVTIGVNRLTWRDALLQVVGDALADSRYDAPLPSGYIADSQRLAGPLADELASLTKSLDAVDVDDVAQERASAFLTHRPSLLAGALVDAVTEIDDNTVLRRRAGSVCELSGGIDKVHVYLGDRELRMPGRLRAAMTLVRDSPTVQVRDLPLDEQSRLVLARRLLREGLLQVDR